MIKTLSTVVSLIALLFLASGCSSKQTYSAQKIDSRITGSSCAHVVALTANGATLSDGTYVYKNKTGKVPKGYQFLNYNQKPIFADLKGNVKVGEQKIALDDRVLSASLEGDLLAFITKSNRFGLFDLENDAIIFQDIGSSVKTINMRVAAPLKVDDLYIFPTLDGQLIVVSNNQIVRQIRVSTQTDFNNVIYLDVLQNSLIAATSHEVISLGGQSLERKRVSVADIVQDGQSIYIFSKNGTLYKTDPRLLIEDEQQFQFANFTVATAVDDTIYVVEKNGHLLQFDKEDRVSVKRLGKTITYESHPQVGQFKPFKIDRFSFITDKTFYSGGQCFNL